MNSKRLSIWAAGLVVPHDAKALSEAIAQVLGEAEVHARLAAGCAKVTLQLGWGEPVRDMEALYAKVAARQAEKQDSRRLV